MSQVDIDLPAPTQAVDPAPPSHTDATTRTSHTVAEIEVTGSGTDTFTLEVVDIPIEEWRACYHDTRTVGSVASESINPGAAPPEHLRRLRVVDQQDPHCPISVRIDDVEIRALLDTGAAVSLINGRTLAKLLEMLRASNPTLLQGVENLGIITPEPYLKLKMAGGDNAAVQPQGTTVLPVVLGSVMRLQRFVVLDSLVHDMILGVDLLLALGAVVDFKNMRVHLSDGAEVAIVELRKQGTERDLREVETARKTSLKARTLTPVTVCLRSSKVSFEGQDGQFVPCPIVYRNLGLLVPQALVKVKRTRLCTGATGAEISQRRAQARGTEPGAPAADGPNSRRNPEEPHKPFPKPGKVVYKYAFSLLVLNPTERDIALPQGTRMGRWMCTKHSPEISAYTTAYRLRKQGGLTVEYCTWKDAEDRDPAAEAARVESATTQPRPAFPSNDTQDVGDRTRTVSNVETEDATADKAARARVATEPEDPERAAQREALVKEAIEKHCEYANVTLEEHREIIARFLSEFSDVFALDTRDAGRTHMAECHVETGDARPIKQRAYRLSQMENEHIAKEVQELLDKGFIRPSNSPWASPVVLAPKADGSLRFCIDYRKLNALATEKEPAYPLPRIEEVLDHLGKAKFFSTLDLCAGYWNVPMAEESIPKTAFVTQQALYEWLVMPFGLRDAPKTFQKLMDVVLSGLTWKCALVYLDDVVIFSDTVEQHLADLRAVFERLRAAGLKVKVSKCKFFAKEVDYLGHSISSEGVKPKGKNIEAIRDLPEPRNVTELRRFLGMAQYYRRFVMGFAHIADPLFNLLKKGEEFKLANRSSGLPI